MNEAIEKCAAMATEEYVRWLAAGNSTGTLSEHAVAGLRKHFADVLNDYASGSYPSPMSQESPCSSDVASSHEVALEGGRGDPSPPAHVVVTFTQAECDELCEIAERDGYEKAVQEIDQLTGGDGEYRVSMRVGGGVDDERHTPDAPSMIQRIVDRFETLNLLRDAEKTGRDQEWGISAEPHVVQADHVDLRDLVERAQAIISTSIYPNWHEAARAALSAPEDGVAVSVSQDGDHSLTSGRGISQVRPPEDESIVALSDDADFREFAVKCEDG